MVPIACTILLSASFLDIVAMRRFLFFPVPDVPPDVIVAAILLSILCGNMLWSPPSSPWSKSPAFVILPVPLRKSPSNWVRSPEKERREKGFFWRKGLELGGSMAEPAASETHEPVLLSLLSVSRCL